MSNQSDEVKALAVYFNKPAAVQLKAPTVAIGNDGTMIDTPDGLVPLPTLEPKPPDPPIILGVLAGVLSAADDGEYVTLDVVSPVYEAKVRYRLHPRDIQYVMVVRRPGNLEKGEEKKKLIV